LDRRRRWEIRQAGKHHVLRPMEDVDEFKRTAYPAYRSFYKRTHYRFRSDRRHQDGFSRWADSIFQTPKMAVLGAYRGSDLGAVSISALVEDTLIYLTAFCDEESLRLNVVALLLHSLRETAAGCPQVKQICLGMYNRLGRTSIHDFYILRGCRIVAKPAVLHVNPIAALWLRLFMPARYAKMCGQLEDAAPVARA
jgi:hypothetical protein